MPRKTILIVDDAEINRFLLSDILSVNYDVIEARSGFEAIEILNEKAKSISLMLLDIVMPEMDGFGVLTKMKEKDWLTAVPVIMISAENSSEYIDHAYDLGATDYITRPFDECVVRHRVQNTLMLYSKQKYLEQLVTQQILERERSNARMVEVLSNIVEFRNGESGLHVLHIRVLTNFFLQRLKAYTDQYDLSSEKIATIANASTLHDIGKISIDEHILNKPGRLTKEEYDVMKTHAQIGASILEKCGCLDGSELFQIARDICNWHHERYDGRGYPDGLKGEEIPIWAQIVALADVYDALTSKRVYKDAYTHEQAVQMITNGECGTFNPLLLKMLEENSEGLEHELEKSTSDEISHSELLRIAYDMIRNGENEM